LVNEDSEKSRFGIIPFWDYAFYMTKSVFSDAYEKFRETLVSARKEASLTQIELANRLGKPQSFVSKFESGERRIDLIEFATIAKVLDIDPCQVLREISKLID
jgi:ribosome-binding protein aMBF1 (putative translation factor)